MSRRVNPFDDLNTESDSSRQSISLTNDFEPQNYQQQKRDQKSDEYNQIKSSTVYITGVSGSDASCRDCGKRVYEMEKVIADEILYHKTCFKCAHCKRLLNLSTYASMDGTPFCKPHFIEMFKAKGQYEFFAGEERLVERIEEGSKPPSTPPVLPAVRNMKDLFEVQGQSPVVPSPRGTMYSKVIASQSPLSKWDKTSEARPQTSVNYVTENDLTEEDVLPPPDITRNLVAKFRSIQQEALEDSPAERKPVRQFTPPRESPERFRCSGNLESEERTETSRDVVRAVDKAEIEEELPPPCITKNLVAMFKSMVVEDDAGSEPQRHSCSTLPSVGRFSGSNARRSGSLTDDFTDGGVFENEPAQPLDVVREMDPTDEQELPEAGITRSLVAQWKTMEQCSPANKSVSPSVSAGNTPRPRAALGAFMSYDESRTDMVGSGGAGNSQEVEAMEEEALPPPDITKNLLAKFKTIEAESQISVNPPSSKKQFKWDVKEVKPVNYPGLMTAMEKNPDEESVVTRATDDDSEEEEEGEQKMLENQNELPPPAFTKIMLSKFRALEKS